MRALFVAAALAACTVGLPASAQQADPLARARDGAVECIEPNVVARTCEIISAYRFEDGEILNDYVMHIQSEPLVLGYGVERVFLRDGMVCSAVTAEDIAAMRFNIDGAQAPEAVTAELRAAFAQALAGIDEMCARYVQDGDRVRVTVFSDGVEQPDLALNMMWIMRADGYTLGGAGGDGT